MDMEKSRNSAPRRRLLAGVLVGGLSIGTIAPAMAVDGLNQTDAVTAAVEAMNIDGRQCHRQRIRPSDARPRG